MPWSGPAVINVKTKWKIKVESVQVLNSGDVLQQHFSVCFNFLQIAFYLRCHTLEMEGGGERKVPFRLKMQDYQYAAKLLTVICTRSVVGNPCQLQIKLHGGIVLDRNQFEAQNALFAVLWLKTTDKKWFTVGSGGKMLLGMRLFELVFFRVFFLSTVFSFKCLM